MNASADSHRRAMSTPELVARLERHYIKPGQPLPGGVFLPEVGWNNGSGAGGCDAIYVGFTSTSGRILVGHELKISRADWLNELNKPGKSDPWADQCHEWWLVVNDPAIVHEGELPAGWGLMSPGTSKTRMRIHKPSARKPADHCPSWLAVRSVIARQDTLRANAIQQGKLAAQKAVQVDVEAEIERRVARAKGPTNEELENRLRLIEEALGGRVITDGRLPFGNDISLDDVKALAEVARDRGALRRAVDAMDQRYRDPLADVKRSVDNLDKALAQFRAIAKVDA